MKPDPIVEEIRKIREKHAAKYGYDLKKIFDAVRAEQVASGRKVVSFAAKKPKRRRTA